MQESFASVDNVVHAELLVDPKLLAESGVDGEISALVFHRCQSATSIFQLPLDVRSGRGRFRYPEWASLGGQEGLPYSNGMITVRLCQVEDANLGESGVEICFGANVRAWSMGDLEQPASRRRRRRTMLCH